MITSVWEGQDYDLIPQLIALHWRSNGQEPVIADVTWGNGRFWKNSGINPIGSDSNPVRAKTLCADFCYLPYKDESIDILVFDPPHIADIGRTRPKIMGEQYGIYWEKHSIVDLSRAFLSEANRVLKRNGIIITKISDQIQTGKHFWNHFEYMALHYLLLPSVPLTICDIVIKVRKNVGPQPWDHQRHVWQRHCYFLVSRKGRC